MGNPQKHYPELVGCQPYLVPSKISDPHRPRRPDRVNNFCFLCMYNPGMHTDPGTHNYISPRPAFVSGQHLAKSTTATVSKSYYFASRLLCGG